MVFVSLLHHRYIKQYGVLLSSISLPSSFACLQRWCQFVYMKLGLAPLWNMVPVPDILVHTPNYLRSNYIILLFRESWRWSEISQDNPTLLIMFIVFSFFLCLASRNTKGRQGGAFRTICCSTRMDATKYGMLLFFFFM